MLGRTVWDVQHKFRIVIGPVDGTLRSLLPGSVRLDSCRRWCATTSASNSTGTCADPAREDVPAWPLGSKPGSACSGARVAERRPDYADARDADDLVMNVEASAAAGPPAPGRCKARSGMTERRHERISRVALFGKLNPVALQAIEGATVFCKMRGNPYVELVHWLAQLLETPGHRPGRDRAPLRTRPRDTRA